MSLADLRRALLRGVRDHAARAADRAERPLNCLQAAREPLPARTVAGVSGVSGVSGVPAATTAEALASLHAKGLITRRRKGRAWL